MSVVIRVSDCIRQCVWLSVSVVIGVPTIKREQESYLPQTLQSLIEGLSDDERLDVIIVVLVAEVDFISIH